MIPSVLSRQLRQGVEDFLRTTFPSSTPFFHGMIDNLLADKNAVFQGPFLSLDLPFRMGERTPAFFPDIFQEHPPYFHQEIAFERLSPPFPRSTVVATGTGSGKTECFLYPILEHCFRRRGEPGIKAILIYPMNALANDQASRLAKKIHDDPNLKGNVVAGLYVGQSEKNPVSGMTRQSVVTCKETMRNSPPDILLTNYKMLDYLLIRARDYPLWGSNGPDTLRYLVVDELHTFDGAQGADLACLLRRLKSRLSIPKDFLCCVGTSATLGERSEEKRLIDYASELFGEKLDDGCIIKEYRVSAGKFLEKSLISRTAVAPPEKAGLLDPKGYRGVSEYIAAQHALWFEETLSPEDLEAGTWRAALGERLKGHLFFHNLLKVLDGRIRRVADVLEELKKVTPEFRRGDDDYRESVLSSVAALASCALEEKNGNTFPFLHVRVHLWLRELRRMAGEASDPPVLRFADDLNEEQSKRHMALVHCRDCGSMGWAGVKRKNDSAVHTDLQSFYVSFFGHDPKTVFIFPEDGEPNDMRTEGQSYRLCSGCLHLSTRISSADCPDCGGSKTIRVFVPDSRSKRRDKLVGNHDCPYCNAKDGLTILGSRAASLASVLIAQLYASTFNDDKKLLTFSDSVQDAAHRAGFFAARTYRFNLRSAVQQFVQDHGAGLRLDAFPAVFVRYWTKRLDESAFVATFLAPNMEWFSDYEALKREGKLPRGSALFEDVRRRVEWEIYSEYGFRCRIGRTLEKSGSSLAYPCEESLDAVVPGCLESLRNEIGGLRSLEERPLRIFMAGLLVHLKHQGGVHHPVLDGYIEEWGNVYLLNRIEWMPDFGMNTRAPAFLTTKRVNRFDLLFGGRSSGGTWYESWAEKCFGLTFALIRENVGSICEIVLKSLVAGGVLRETRIKGERVWGIEPSALRIGLDVVRMRCTTCGHEISAAASETGLWTGAACLRFHCAGTYGQKPPKEDYYGKLYASGDIERIFAEEHTGLLEREYREDLERRFKRKDRAPWDPNLLSCTPTLEMGIDIGDLSSVILCSVPPGQANYMQRVGRAGRRDGNSLVMTAANARPHDLYFFAAPEEMIAGRLDPPGVFLNASAVLERQFTAFCMDRWVEAGASDSALPSQLRHVLGNLEKADPKKFPYNFLSFIETNRTDLLDRFLAIFSGSLSKDSAAHLKTFAEGDEGSEGSLAYKIVDGLHFRFKERESLKKKVAALSAKIRQKRQSPAKDKNYVQELEELVLEKNALQVLVTRINDRRTLNFFTDEGLIPNYAFPEAGVVLRSIIYRRKRKAQEGESKYDTFSFDYERPASGAIGELAPENRFYAGGRKVRVDQVDLAVSEIETWRFCPECSCCRLAGKEPETSACPECGAAMWTDAGQQRRMVRMKQVFATTDDRQSRIGDDTEEREPAFFNRQVLLHYRESDVGEAYAIDGDELPFGVQFLKRATLREVNFGEKGEAGENVTISGVESARKGFVLCKHCGKVQDRKNEIRHALWCPARKKDSEENLAECVYLYREFSSEAILILLPVATFEGSDTKPHSFIAALHLGLKKVFGGNIDHLRTAEHEEPVPDSGFRKKYLVLYDTVPGGTGYLKQLMRSPQPLLNVFEAALETLKSCSCNRDPVKDGCYRCLFAYRNSYDMAGTSRKAASEMLSGILRLRDRMVPTRSLKGVQVNALFDSCLEARFIEALRRVKIDDKPARLKKEVVEGKPGYFYRIGDKAYYIEPQAQLGPKDNVKIASKADFLFRPARLQEGLKPVAVFTDGFFYHKDRIGKDMEQRGAIVKSGKFLVWSLAWKDIENRFKSQGDYFHNFLAFSGGSKATAYGKLLDSFQAKKLVDLNASDSFDWLVRFLSDPDEERWRCHAFVHGAMHLDAKRFSAEREKEGWLEKLRSNFPEEIAEQMGGAGGDGFLGLSEGDSEDFAKIFVSMDKESLRNKDASGMRVACRFSDGAAERGKKSFESAWNGFLRFYNLLQFLKRSFFHAGEGGDAGRSWEAAGGVEAEGSVSDEWAEIKELTEPEMHGLIDRLAEAGGAIPEVGYELTGKNGEIVGEAELAWPELKIAVLDEGQMKNRDAFLSAGWRVFEPNEGIDMDHEMNEKFSNHGIHETHEK